MTQQIFNVGDKVLLKSPSHPWSKVHHTVITVMPVYKRTNLLQKLKALLYSGREGKVVIDYIYRCKSSMGMADFLQGDLEPRLITHHDPETSDQRKRIVA